MTKNFCDKCGGVLQPTGVFRYTVSIGTTAFRTHESTPMGLSHTWMYCQGCFDDAVSMNLGRPVKVWREHVPEFTMGIF